jgi:protein-S-isoprenylcysteine O-methyltransferase Ste14
LRLGRFLYRYRSLTPVPLLFVLLFFSEPTPVSLGLGAIVTVCGEVIRFISVGYTGLTTRSKNVQTNILVTNGPYGFVRNPIYLGNFFLSLGIVITANSFFPWFIVIYIILFSIQYFYIIKYEERFLKNRFGEEYSRYEKKVPCFFPGVKSYKSCKPVIPAFRMALRSEKTTLFILFMIYSLLGLIYLWKLEL